MSNVENYKEQGGAVTVIGGELRIASGGTITAAGTQAAAISDFSGTGNYTNDEDAIETAVNSILAALRGAGIIAAS